MVPYRCVREMCRPVKNAHSGSLSTTAAFNIKKTRLYNVYSKTGVYRGIHDFSYFCSKT